MSLKDEIQLFNEIANCYVQNVIMLSWSFFFLFSEAFDKAFNEMDKNGDGTLSRAEVTTACRQCGCSDAEIDDMIKSIDKDGDGQISKKEFMTLV